MTKLIKCDNCGEFINPGVMYARIEVNVYFSKFSRRPRSPIPEMEFIDLCEKCYVGWWRSPIDGTDYYGNRLEELV
jgi:hypothetical protein